MSRATRPASRNDFEIAIVCALTLEADAVASLFDHDWDDGEEAAEAPYDKASGDPNAYSVGRIGRHDVVVAHMPGMGKVRAAAVAANCRASWPNVKLALIVGICGAVPFPGGIETILGDVIIGSGIVQYDFGKRLPERFVRKDTLLDSTSGIGMEIRSLLGKLQSLRDKKKLQSKMVQHLNQLQQESELRATYPGVEYDVLFEAIYRHAEDGMTCEKAGCNGKLVQRRRLQQGSPPTPTVHIGLVASGDTVMKSGSARDEIAEQEDIIAFEMEGAGVAEVLPCLVIKGACDYADSHKTKAWQNYAAATAAACTKAFLEFWTPSPRGGGYEICPVINTAGKGKSRNVSLIPYTRNESFINREEILAKLPDPSISSTGQRRIAIFGLGGSGKTQIAIEYAYRAQEKNPSLAVFWVHAGTAERFCESYASLALECNITCQNKSETETMKLVTDWIVKDKDRPWLVVLDNVDDGELLRPSTGLRKYIPEASHVCLFVTTRNKQCGLDLIRNRGKDLLEIGAMTDGESCELLRASLGQPNTNSVDLTDLSDRLERLPLALVQAAAFIEAQSISVKSYLKLLKSSDRSFMRLLDEDFETVGRHCDTLSAVAQTWVLSFEQIQRQNPVAAEILSLLCFYDKNDIEYEFLRRYLCREARNGYQDEDETDFQVVKAIGVLKAFSLVTTGTNEEALNIHPLVQLVTRKWLEEQGTIESFASQAMFALSKCFPDAEYENWGICRKYMPHVESVFRFRGTNSRDERLERADLLLRKAKQLTHEGRCDEAERDGSPALQTRLELLGDEHSETLIAMEILTSVYTKQGRVDEAEQLHAEVLNTRKRTLGPNHVGTLKSLRFLSTFYRFRNRLDEALELGKANLDTCKKFLGMEAEETWLSMAQVAMTLLKKGSFREASTLLVALMDHYESTLGLGHPRALANMNNIAVGFWCQGFLKEAEWLGEKVFKMTNKTLGYSHPYTFISMHNLACIWWSQGRRVDAITLMRECASERSKIIGCSNILTRYSMQQVKVWTLEEEAMCSVSDDL